MSGNPTGSNVVPMPHAAAPASSPMPMPGMWGGGGTLPWGPGCCPPGGMDALLKCYCDVQAATAFICSVMVQCVQNNPAVVQAIITAIENSGSALPTLGVTNGTDAQPGQVGEWLMLSTNITLPAGNSSQVVSLGSLQPGDWDMWLVVGWVSPGTNANFIEFNLLDQTGFSSNLATFMSTLQSESVMVSTTARALTSVPTLIAADFVADTVAQAATAVMTFMARRRR